MSIANCRRSMGQLVIASSCLLLTAGCGRPPQPNTGTQANRPTDDTVVSVTEMLRQGADVNAWRSYIQQLNHYLDVHPNAPPGSLSKEEQEFLAKHFSFDKDELTEVQSRTFTLLDVHYLDLAFVLRDAARTLNLDDLAPLDRVRNGFAWVVRQVRLQQGKPDALARGTISLAGASGFAAPPLAVLRRGWGTARERDLIFLALLDQLGIDGCMVVLPAGAPGRAQLRDWVPGALIDKDIYLFDTRLGVPLPGPDGKGIATLAQVRAGLGLRQMLQVDDKYPYDVGPESSRQVEVQVAYSLSSLAPRMEFLQNYLAASEKINLWVDPVARFKRFQAVAETVRVWNAPADVNNPLRVLRAFLPREEGGVAQQPFRELVRHQVVPWQYFPQQLNLPGEPGQQLRTFFAAPFYYFNMETRMSPELLVLWLPGLAEASVDKPGTRKLSESLLRSPLPRDLILHGRCDEAATLLVTMRDELRRQKALPGGAKLDEAVRRWSERAIAVYADLSRAEETGKISGKEAASASAVAEAKERVNQLWSGPESVPARILLQTSAAEPMLERVVYLLALCKQEQAERLQVRRDQAGRLNKPLSSADVKTLADSWTSAASWWETYLNEHASAPAAPAARLLRARALQALGDRAAAVALLENLTGVSSDLEKTARLYLAKQLRTR